MAIKMDNYGNVYNDELFHYGKKGMKWGKHVMAQEKYWITGNGRTLGTGGNSGGFQDVNSRMRNDTSGIKWKPSVPANVNNPRVRGASAASIWSKRDVGLGTSRDSVKVSKTKSNINPRYYSNTPSAWMNKNGQNKVLNSAKNRSNKVVPTSNPAIKGVNTTPQGGFGAKTFTSKKAEMLKNKDTMRLGGVEKPEYGARNALLFNSSVSNRVGSTMKKSISAIQKDQSGLLYKAKKTVNRIFKKISKFFGW